MCRIDGQALTGDGVPYDSEWLSRYDEALDTEDRCLKHAESACTLETLQRERLWGRIGSFLDVGTCTGRYLLRLGRGIRPDGRVVGLDADPESVRFARRKVACRDWNGTRISVVRRDFTDPELDLPGGRFELITAMMSTISHFGKNGYPDGHGARPEDRLQRALRRFCRLLEEDGLLIFSVWSRQAIESGDLLTIFEPDECRRLSAWTPTADELSSRLDEAGLTRRRRVRPHRRLDVWICRR